MNFYRYTIWQTGGYDSEYDTTWLNPPEVQVTEYKLMRETPKGYWIGHIWDTKPFKWISKTSRKRFAYPTKEEALNGFLIRTKRRIEILKSQIYQAEQALMTAERINGDIALISQDVKQEARSADRIR